MVFERKIRNDAQEECEKVGANLTSIHSEEEMNFVDTLNEENRRGDICIGGYRELGGNSFKWADGSPFKYDNWAKGQPDNADEYELCIYFYSEPGEKNHKKWKDVRCDLISVGYVCKKDI